MNGKIAKAILLFLTVSFVTVQSVYPLEVETHEAINEMVAKGTPNSFSIDSYLKRTLGIAEGVNVFVDNKKVLDWVKMGGRYEDKPPWTVPYTRSFNHFHDPLKTWDVAGFKGTWLSSILWSQMPRATQYPGGNYSWFDTRDYFYKAITSSNKIDKSKYLSETFRGIGQLMHLVQDAAVPAHTRNDTHAFGYHYELAVNKMRANGDPVFTNAVANPITFDAAILTFSPNSFAPIPIAKIFDTDQYNDPNPNPSVTYSNAIGLSEFTNANFFSEDTIFKDYPHPTKSNTTAALVEQYAKDGKKDKVYYIQGYTSERLAAYSYLNKWLSPDKWEYNLDDFVYSDYASQLIPRAVGYSAGLLNYFFRGSIGIIRPDSGMYAQTSDPAQGFTRITLRAENTTSTGEEMADGSIELVVKYRLALEDPFKNYPPDYPFQATSEFSYIVAPEANGIRSIPRGGSTTLTFNLGNPIPLWAIDVYLQVVYHGKLGNEEGAVVVGTKDISEPTPVDLFNDMDVICLNGRFYSAGSPEAIAQVDANHDGMPEWDIYHHDVKNVYTSISPADAPVYASPAHFNSLIPSIQGGYYVRAFYILSDYNFSYSSYETYTNSDPGDPWGPGSVPAAVYSGIAIKNQRDYVEDPAVCSPMSAPCYIWWYPTFLSYRSTETWWGSGIMFANNAYPAESECSCYEGILRTCPKQQLNKSSLSFAASKGVQAGIHVDKESGKTFMRRVLDKSGMARQGVSRP